MPDKGLFASVGAFVGGRPYAQRAEPRCLLTSCWSWELPKPSDDTGIDVGAERRSLAPAVDVADHGSSLYESQHSRQVPAADKGIRVSRRLFRRVSDSAEHGRVRVGSAGEFPDDGAAFGRREGDRPDHGLRAGLREIPERDS